MRTYPRETVVAEKLEAIVKSGMLNTRFKQYYDLHYLCDTFDFEGATLARAIVDTFERRGTRIPAEVPMGVAAAFSDDRLKRTQWGAFRKRLGERASPESLADVVHALIRFLEGPLRAAASGHPFEMHWKAQGPWEAALA